MDINCITERIIGAAIAVHKELGPGLLESIYEECITFELHQRGLRFDRQVPIAIVYKGAPLKSAYRIDLVVEGKVIVELKSVASIDDIHKAQLLTYLRLSGCHPGLIINFNVALLKNGIKRLVLNLPEPPSASSAPLR